jgi:hypothetical protein
VATQVKSCSAGEDIRLLASVPPVDLVAEPVRFYPSSVIQKLSIRAEVLRELRGRYWSSSHRKSSSDEKGVYRFQSFAALGKCALSILAPSL